MELILFNILVGGLVAVATQAANNIQKKLKKKYKIEVNPLFFVAFFSVILSGVYALIVTVTPADWLNVFGNFATLAFSGAVTVFNIYQQIEKHQNAKNKSN